MRADKVVVGPSPNLRVVGVLSDLRRSDAKWLDLVPVQHFPPWVRQRGPAPT